MTGGESTRDDAADGTDATETADADAARTATIRSAVDAPATVAAAISPDNTDQIETAVEDGRLVTEIRRDSTGGLEATIDDYVVALDVATTVVAHANRHDTQP